MTVTLTPELEAIVNEQLAGGQFTTPEQVVHLGLHLLQRQYAELKAMIAESVAQADRGELEPLDIRATLARVKGVVPVDMEPNRAASEANSGGRT